ncbi:MAG: tartrate dehydrogenase [Woeseiaceae bacterium]|nr:tartrate dehydrogenase [Woeseiaceae bacterium]
MADTVKIAAIPGDGIGKEIIPEGLKVMNAAASCCDFGLNVTDIGWANADYYAQHGRMMPADWRQQLVPVDAIYLGAVGWPATVPDHVSLWESILSIRREFDQYVNLRPVRLFDGVRCPLSGYQPGDIDMVIVRENTEGEYTNVGGPMYAGTDREIVLQQSVFSRHGTDRILRYAFELAQSRPRKRLTVATKSNGVAISMPWWDERAEILAAEYPDVDVDFQHIDILTARFVLDPKRFDVVVASNLFGDILSDLGPACAGTIGIAPSANINPTGDFPSLFEPVHGSAPDIAGKGIANPIAAIWSAALMLKVAGKGDARFELAHDRMMAAIVQVLKQGPHTPDLGGSATTEDVGTAIAETVMTSNRQRAIGQ